MDFLTRTRDGYDATASAYAAHFDSYLDGKPIERAMLVAFAGLVQATANRAVADVGCGTGITTAMLHDAGVVPTGIDLSPNMIELAGNATPPSSSPLAR